MALLILLLIQLITMSVQGVQISIPSNDDNIIVVDINGEGDYTSIQEAIDKAKPGSTISVKKGVYSEIIIIKKQINLIGEDKNSTLINPISEKNKYAISLGAPDIIIQSFSIKNGAPGLYTNGIRIISPKTEVRNCNVFDTPVGIAIWTSNNIIDNCHFWNCKDEGIALIGSSYSECNENKITNCVFNKNCDGIELQHSSNNLIYNCAFYDNTHSGIDAITSSNNKNTISNCKIYNNEVHGIYLSSSSENKIIDCLIMENEDGNIVMRKNSENNQIISNSKTINSRITIREIIFRLLSKMQNSKIMTIFNNLNCF